MTRVSDTELLTALGAVSIRREPYEYATSSPLEQLSVQYASGATTTLLLKDLHRDQLIGAARDSKPVFLFEPQREITVYRALLGPAALGPKLHACGDDWMVIEKVPGTELWQIGELSAWQAVARWLAEVHSLFAIGLEAVRDANPYLLDYADPATARTWLERARTALTASTEPDAARLLSRLDRAADELAVLSRLPHTLVHGEFYPSNVLVATSGGRITVWPVDWEMASIGPGLLDLAALVGGWTEAEQAEIVEAYGVVDRADLDRCRLSLALQWIGWAPGWKPPDEHAHDWIGEALDTLERLS